MGEILVQKIRKTYEDSLEVAIKYFSVLDTLNDLELTKRDIQLLAFTAIRGTISSVQAKEIFCKKFGSTVSTVNNMISKLRSKGLLVKDEKKIKINAALNLDFTKSMVVQIQLKTKEPSEVPTK